MRIRGIATVAAVLLMALPLAAAAVQETIDGVLHVMNGSQPSLGREIVQLEEVWRVGGEDSEDFFGMISQVAVGQDGLIYLLDTRLSEVPVYDVSGERVNTLSREGEGPGETRIPSNLLFMPDGSLGLMQVFPGKITKIDTEGNPVGVFQPGGGDPTQGGFMQFFDCAVQGENLVISGEEISQIENGQVRTNFLASFDQDGNELVRYWESTLEMDFANFELDEGRFRLDFRCFVVGPDGRTYVATSRDDYEITVYNPDGTVDRVIEREFTPVERSDEERARLRANLENRIRAPFEVKITVSEVEPTITWVSIGHDGNLWVTHSRSGIEQDGEVMLTCDVFDLDGTFLRQVSAACPGDGVEDILIWTPDGSALHVTGYRGAVESLQGGGGTGGEVDEEAEPMEVIYLKVAGI